jgi:hypothetical protein
MKTPLLVVVLRRGDAPDTHAYARVLRDTFVGNQVATVTSVPKELLQAAEFRELAFDGASVAIPRALIESADRVLVVLLDAVAPVAGDDSLMKTEQALKATPGLTSGNSLILNVSLKTPDSLFMPGVSAGGVVRLGLGDLDERDLRLPFLMLYALHNAMRLFATTPADPTTAPGPTSLFFSHAKRDGVPLTTAVTEWMRRLKGFDAFYDTKNLDLDDDIETQLRGAIESAIVVVFRTDIFDQRYWCQKEVLWADQHGRPVITVDARWQIEHSASVVSFDSTPVVRIPDGNLVRIFAAALVEALRIELFRARAAMLGAGLADAAVAVIPRYPSLVSLHHACSQLSGHSQTRRVVVYPNPSLPATMARAVAEIAQGLVPGSSVMSLDELRLIV